jgi:hypothetical protein
MDMDIELKQHLDATEARSVRLVTDLKEGLEHQIHSLEVVTTDVKESLGRQLKAGFEDMATRFDTQSNKLDRQAALIQTSNRWTNRMNDWAENVGVALEKQSQEIGELRIRLEKIEGGAK